MTQSGSIVTFSLGSLAVGQTATATVTAEALDAGNLSDTASATSSLVDANPVQQYRGRVGARGRSGDRGLRAAHHHQQTLTNQTVATFTHANGVEPASAFVATINWGDATTSTGTITQVGQHLFGDRLPHVCGERHVHHRDLGGRTGPRAASQHLDAAGESRSQRLRHATIRRYCSDGSVLVRSAQQSAAAQKDSFPTPQAVTSTARGRPRPASRSPHGKGATHDRAPRWPRSWCLGACNNASRPLNDGEIYNPLSRTPGRASPTSPESTFGDGPTMLLPDGRVLAGSIDGPQTYIYDPATDTWSAGPTKLYGDRAITNRGRCCPMAASSRTT